MADTRLKQIRIKTGVVKRLAKEKVSYAKEAEKEKGKLEKLQLEGGDSHVIQKQEEIIRECLMMIPDCHRRLKESYSQLKELVDNEVDLAEKEEYQAAEKILKDVVDEVSNE